MLIDALTNVVEAQEKERVIGIVLCSKVKTSRRDRILSDPGNEADKLRQHEKVCPELLPVFDLFILVLND